LKEDNEKEQFSRIPHALVDSGLLAQMTKAEMKVYMVICRYAHYKSGIAFPGFKRICKESGINKNYVGSTLKKLVVYGLIKMHRAPGAFKFRNVFKIIRDPKISNIISPSYKDKRKGICRDKGGKWRVSPSYKDSNICPSYKESDISPSNKDKKENEVNGNRDSINNIPSFTISKKTIKELEKTKGEAWVTKELKRKGYVVEKNLQ